MPSPRAARSFALHMIGAYFYVAEPPSGTFRHTGITYRTILA